MDKNELKISWYSSLLIALMVNVPRLLALREKGIVAQFWHFNAFELLFQFSFNFLFCWLIFQLNLKQTSLLSICREQDRKLLYCGLNIFLFVAAVLIGGIIQHNVFPNLQLSGIYLLSYFVRLGLSGILIAILIKIVLLIRGVKSKEIENEQLKTAYVQTELELLKAQMNPHFLFNSLSSLSGIIRENPILAQKYVRDLSTVFRYALIRSKNNLVRLEDELVMLDAVAQLIVMRLEKAFEFNVDIPQSFFSYQLPHLTLQPLLENAVKHNGATLNRPLKISVFIENNWLVMSNSIYEIPTPESSNGLGLANLSERFKIMMKQEIEIIKTGTNFIVKIPLKA
jgi:two-component system LytT family sensor kinase